jgi:hypothetical protein
MTSPLGICTSVMAEGPAAASSSLNPTGELLVAAEIWAAGNGTRALHVSFYDNWVAHATTDGASWTWPEPPGMQAWKNETVTSLELAGMNVTCTGDIPADLADYDLVVISAYYACSPAKVAQMEAFINNGGGLILSGGVSEYFRVDAKDTHTWMLPTDPLSANIGQWMGFSQYGNSGGSVSLVVDRPFNTSLRTGATVFSVPSYPEGYGAITGVTGTTIALWDNTGMAFAASHQYGQGRFYYQSVISLGLIVVKATVQGTVVAPHHYPIASAAISVDGDQVTAAVSNGSFSALVEPGLHDIAISAQGYVTVHRTVDLSEGALISLGVVELAVDQNGMGLGRYSDGTDYSLLIPTHWGRTTNVTIADSKFVLKLDGPLIGTVNSNILLQSGRDNSISSLDSYKFEFINETIKELAEQGITASVYEAAEVFESAGDKCLVFSLQYAGYPLTQKFGVVLNESTHQYWVLTCTTSTEAYDRDAPMFDQIIQSLQGQGSVEAAPMDKVVLAIVFVVVAVILCAAVVLGFQRKKGA